MSKKFFSLNSQSSHSRNLPACPCHERGEHSLLFWIWLLIVDSSLNIFRLVIWLLWVVAVAWVLLLSLRAFLAEIFLSLGTGSRLGESCRICLRTPASGSRIFQQTEWLKLNLPGPTYRNLTDKPGKVQGTVSFQMPTATSNPFGWLFHRFWG